MIFAFILYIHVHQLVKIELILVQIGIEEDRS